MYILFYYFFEEGSIERAIPIREENRRASVYFKRMVIKTESFFRRILLNENQRELLLMHVVWVSLYALYDFYCWGIFGQ